VGGGTYQGFGATTPGGAGQPVYHVTHLQDSGPGSLRDAVSRGNRRVVFDVAGEISLNDDIRVKGAFITIDGFTAPSPRITLKNHGLVFSGEQGAHDVIVQGIRVRNSLGCDKGCSSYGGGLLIVHEAYNVVVDHVSVQGSQNFAISVNKGAHDITIQWSLFAENQGKTQLLSLISGWPKGVGAPTGRISMHHNLLMKANERLPQVKFSEVGVQAPDVQIDLRNNLIWDWSSTATRIWKGAKANVVNNYYYAPNASPLGQRRAIYFCHAGSTPPQCDASDPKLYARAYIAGNVSGHGPEITHYLNKLGTESAPFAVPSVETVPPCTAAEQVLAQAGVRPLDAIDQQYVSAITLPSCPGRSSFSQKK
ncbi:MAG: hypothetical protein ACREOH_01190, partial [Candidatus Entotheonellia bacterium]